MPQLMGHLGGISHYQDYEEEGSIKEHKDTREAASLNWPMPFSKNFLAENGNGSIGLAEQFISLYPESALPYVTKGNLYILLGTRKGISAITRISGSASESILKIASYFETIWKLF
ncbi:MAG: hypothetical protein ACQER7_15900 [Bacteroidota bacterium]